MLSALGAREDDLVDVGERDVGIAVVQEGGGGDLLRRRRQVPTLCPATPLMSWMSLSWGTTIPAVFVCWGLKIA